MLGNQGGTLAMQAKARELRDRSFEDEQKRKRSAARSSHKAGPGSTACALKHGTENPNQERLERQSRFPTENWRVPLSRTQPALVRSEPAILEDHPILDLGALGLTRRMKEKVIWSHSLDWKDTPVAAPAMLLIADFWERLAPFLVLDVGDSHP